MKKQKVNGLYEFKLQAVRKKGTTWTKSNFGKVNYRLFASTTQKLTAGKKGFTVKVKKVSKATGYQVVYSVKKNMKSSKIRTYKGVNKIKLKVGKLKAKKVYYVRSRPYRIYKGHKYIGVLNSVKKVKTKR